MNSIKPAIPKPLLTLRISVEQDLVLARQRTRQISQFLGFDERDQTGIATAVSEIARNALGYAGGGRIEFQLDQDDPPKALLIRIADSGPGIQDLRLILEGRYRSETGMGMGIIGAQRLMDQLEIESATGRGTEVTLHKLLPRKGPALPLNQLSDITEQWRVSATPFDEIKQQNQELLRLLEELRNQQQELAQLNRELEDTNRGVVALYAELDEKAIHLKEADQIKSRFLSNMSHEFRTPLNSILALTRILSDRLDGDLTPEQAKQVAFISKSAEDLLMLVNDLLDLAKVEAGKLTVHCDTFEMKEVFGTLRGLLKPLLTNERVTLVIEDPVDIPRLYSDESKIAQILRNFVSNALKFTECGEIRVFAKLDAGQQSVILSVSDTGIGIAPEHQTLVFQEFSQLDNPLQRKVRGTGLGLPLAKKLTELLGGSISVKSDPGLGSVFSVRIPLQCPESHAEPKSKNRGGLSSILLVDTKLDATDWEERLRASGFAVMTAPNLSEVEQKLMGFRPKAILVNVSREGTGVLAGLKALTLRRQIPILALTETIEDETRARALGADACCIKTSSHQELVEILNQLIRDRGEKEILMIDDEEISRYLLRGLLIGCGHSVIEAHGGEEGIRLACERQPKAIFLDLIMPDLTGHEVLERLAANPMTRGIPILIMTSKALTEEESQRLSPKAAVVLSKSVLADEQKATYVREALLKAGIESHRKAGDQAQ